MVAHVRAHDTERQDQIKDGQSRTLSLKSGHERERKPYAGTRPRGTRGGAAKKPSGHDAILKDMQAREVTVELFLMNSSDPMVGQLIASDKFTISVKANGRVHHLFKHGIESFSEVIAA